MSALKLVALVLCTAVIFCKHAVAKHVSLDPPLLCEELGEEAKGLNGPVMLKCGSNRSAVDALRRHVEGEKYTLLSNKDESRFEKDAKARAELQVKFARKVYRPRYYYPSCGVRTTTSLYFQISVSKNYICYAIDYVTQATCTHPYCAMPYYSSWWLRYWFRSYNRCRQYYCWVPVRVLCWHWFSHNESKFTTTFKYVYVPCCCSCHSLCSSYGYSVAKVLPAVKSQPNPPPITVQPSDGTVRDSSIDTAPIG